MADVFTQLEAWEAEAEAFKIENKKLRAEIVTLTQYQGDMYRDYLTECNALHEKIKELEAALTFCIDTDKESQARIVELEEKYVLDASDPEIGPQIKNICEWIEDETNCGVYKPSCGGDGFVLNCGTPSENKMKFCCFCGKELIVITYEDLEANQ